MTLTAAATAGSVFGGWSGGGCSDTNPTCVVTVTSATTVTTRFDIQPNVIFVTQPQPSANLGGINGADNLCAMSAMSANLGPGTYRAWLSDSFVNAANRIGSGTGWVRPDGRPVFNTQTDLTSGRVMYLPTQDAFGVDVGSQSPMTGTFSFGFSSGQNCNDWFGSFGQGLAGSTRFSNGQWTELVAQPCNQPVRIYCLGVNRQGTALPPPPAANARRAFFSNGSFNPATGLGAADALCASEAAAAALPGTYLAFLATVNATAASRFNTAGGPWVRVDDVRVADTAAGLMSQATWNTGLNRTASNSLPATNQSVWTGASTPNALGTAMSTCNNWTTGAGTIGTAGNADSAVVGTAFGQTPNSSCGTSARIYCLQQ